MALPNLSALRLAEAERRVDTEEWAQYDPSLQRVVDNEDLQECPICAERFEPGDWLWKTNRGPGGAFQYYTPREYWKALKSRNGVDPMMSDRPVSDDDVKELVHGPPGALHDYIDDPPTDQQLEELLAQWRAAREGRARGIRVEDGVPEEGDEEYEDEEEEEEDSDAEEWEQALDTPIEGASWDQWIRQLISRGLTMEELTTVLRTGGPDQLILDLNLDQSFLGLVRGVTRIHSGDGAFNGATMRWHAPFYSGVPFGWTPDTGVIYEWRPLLGDTFSIRTQIHQKSQLGRLMFAKRSRMYDLVESLFNQTLCKVVLRSFLGIAVGGESSLLDELVSFVYDRAAPFAMRVTYDSYRGADYDKLQIYISPKFMVWLCQDAWVNSGPNEMPPNPLPPLPPYASLDAAFARPADSTQLDVWRRSSGWGNPQSKQLWERALDKMSRAMSAVVEDAIRGEAPADTPIHLPARPFQPGDPFVKWEPSANVESRFARGLPRFARLPSELSRADLEVSLKSSEAFWYAVPSDGDGNL